MFLKILLFIFLLAAQCGYAQGTFEYSAQLNGSNVVPSNNSAATATGTFSLNGQSLGYSLVWSAPAIFPTRIEIHGPANEGNTAGALFNLEGTSGTWPPAGVLFGVIELSPSQVSDLNQGLWYVDFHTTSFPDGEIWGQIIPVPEPSTLALIAIAAFIILIRAQKLQTAINPFEQS